MNKKTIVYVLFLAGMIFPFVYLFLNAKKDQGTAAEKPVDVVAADLTQLEQQLTVDSSYENLLNLSVAYISQGMPGKSTGLLKQAIRLRPDQAIAWNNYGVACIQLQQFQDGIDACTKAVTLDTAFQLAKNNLKWAMDEKAKVMEAIAVQEKTAVSERSSEFYIAYGLNYFKIGNYDRSIAIWQELVKKNSGNFVALNNIGTALMMENRVQDAVILFKQIVEKDPNNALAKNNLVWAQSELNKPPFSIEK